jgi:hypothetical protein
MKRRTMAALRRKDGPKNKRKETEGKVDGWKELLKICLYCSHKEEMGASSN